VSRFSHPSPHKSYSSKFVGANLKPTVVEEKPKTKAILVSRNLGGIGDMLMITPSIHQIKRENPDKLIIVCTTERYGRGALFEILANNPDIDRTITVNELSNYEFEKVYNFGTGKEVEIETTNPGSHRIDIFAELAGLTLEDKKPVYAVTPQEKAWAKKWIQKNVSFKRQRLIGIQVGATTARRTWPAEKQWLLTFKLLNKYPDSTILFFSEGSPPETEIYPNIISLGNMHLRQVVALLNECEVVVCPDSGLLHIAGALGKKTVALFGPNPPRTRILYYPNAVGVWIAYPCSPCWYERCFNEFRCMTGIPVEMVMEKVEELLREVVKRDSPDFKKGTLVIRMGGIGDLILLSSSLRSYKEKHPEDRLTLATKPEHLDVLKGAPFLDEIIPIPDSYSFVYESVKDLRYKVESPEVGGTLAPEIYKKVNRSDVFDQLMGVSGENKRFYVNVNEQKVEFLKKKLHYSKRSKWLGIQATCTSNTRTFPPETVKALTEKFSKVPKLKVVVFGQMEFWHGRRKGIDFLNYIGQEKNVFNLLGSTTLEEMAALCSIMDFIIGPDSSAIHIGGALGKKTLAVFGNMDPFLRVYYYPTVKALYPRNELPCIPCCDFTNPCIYYRGWPLKDQPIGGECMRKLTPERIFKEAKGWFEL